MSEETNKPSDDEQKPAPIAEVLIATGLKMAQEQELTLGELVGHFEIAKFEVYGRVTAGAKAQAAAAQTSEPVEGGDTEKTEDALTVEDGGKA